MSGQQEMLEQSKWRVLRRQLLRQEVLRGRFAVLLKLAGKTGGDIAKVSKIFYCQTALFLDFRWPLCFPRSTKCHRSPDPETLPQ
jgi:hypothetical protein